MVVSPAAQAQQVTARLVRINYTNGDTLPQIDLPMFQLYATRLFKNPAHQRKNNRLIRNVKKVYPYAHLAGIKLKEYEILLRDATTKKQQRALMRQAENELERKYGKDLRRMTFSQGKILIKLIYRETGNSSFEVLEELRGKFIAFFWQSLARVFGYNLKIEYDPYGKDHNIEMIVQMIEHGYL